MVSTLPPRSLVGPGPSSQPPHCGSPASRTSRWHIGTGPPSCVVLVSCQGPRFQLPGRRTPSHGLAQGEAGHPGRATGLGDLMIAASAAASRGGFFYLQLGPIEHMRDDCGATGRPGLTPSIRYGLSCYHPPAPCRCRQPTLHSLPGEHSCKGSQDATKLYFPDWPTRHHHHRRSRLHRDAF